MRQSSITTQLGSDIEHVWDVVTDNTNTAWRSDLLSVELVNETTFVEHHKSGISIMFYITKKEYCKRYAFTMRTKHWTGEWEGSFAPGPNGTTYATFAERLHIPNVAMRVLSYLFMNLKKIQQQYVVDLKQALKAKKKDIN